MFVIDYNENTDVHIVDDTFDGKKTYYMENNVKVHYESFLKLLEAKAPARNVMRYVLSKMRYNSTRVTIDREEIKRYCGSKDNGMVKDGINQLIELGIIKPVNIKDKIPKEFIIPMNNIVKGNVNAMVEKALEEQKQIEIAKKENEIVDSYNKIYKNQTNKRKNNASKD